MIGPRRVKTGGVGGHGMIGGRYRGRGATLRLARGHPAPLRYDLARWSKIKAVVIEFKGNILFTLTDELVLDRFLGRDTPAPESLTCELGLFGRDVVVRAL